MSEKMFVVPNISCGHCVAAVQEEVGEIAGVQSVTASAETKEVRVVWDAPATWAQIEAKLVEIEYPPVGL